METMAPLHVYRFLVEFHEEPLHARRPGQAKAVAHGAFSEVTGLEATMEPKEIKEGGRNYGPAQRAGPVTFGTVVLKRGLTATRDLWRWWEMVCGGRYGYRLTAVVTLLDAGGQPAWQWSLRRCLPVKFKTADLKADGGEIGIEELHLAHEGLLLEDSGSAT